MIKKSHDKNSLKIQVQVIFYILQLYIYGDSL